MQSQAATVREYLAELPSDRRAAMEAVRAVILQNLDPVFEEGMQHGMNGSTGPHSSTSCPRLSITSTNTLLGVFQNSR